MEVEEKVKLWLPGQSVAFDFTWQKEGRRSASVALSLKPRLGSLRSLTRMQRQRVLLIKSLLSSVQQLGVGVLTSPVTYSRHEDRPSNWSWHCALSWAKSELTQTAIIRITKDNTRTPFLAIGIKICILPRVCSCICSIVETCRSNRS